MDLYFTNRRVIVAKTGSNLGWALAFGAIGTIAAQHSANKRSEELKQLSAESVLKSDKKNYEIQNELITKIEVRKPTTFKAALIKIYTNFDKYEFILPDKKDFENTASLLNKMFSTKLTIE